MPRRPDLPCPERPVDVQSWDCGWCGVRCTRIRLRGQPPKWCADCRAMNVWQLEGRTCRVRLPKQPKPKPEPRFTPRFCRIFVSDCVSCGNVFTSRYTVSTCSEQCKRDKHAIDRSNERHRRRARVSLAYVEPVHWRKVYAEHGPACHLCGYDTNPLDFRISKGSDGRDAFIAGLEYPTLDHVLALSKGGAHDMSNARLAHLYCNSAKCDQALCDVA